MGSDPDLINAKGPDKDPYMSNVRNPALKKIMGWTLDLIIAKDPYLRTLVCL